MNIWYVILWEFKNNKHTTETAKKVSGVYVITDHQVRNWFTRFRLADMWLRDEPRPGHSSDLDQDT